MGVRFLALVKDGLKELRNPFANSRRQRGEVAGVGSGVRCSANQFVCRGG